MATVTGMTAAAMQAIRDGTVVNGAFNSAGHLILTKYDGTQIDAGAVLSATAVQAGIVELATSAEVQAGTDTTRAITPAGLASLPGYRVQIVTGIAESAAPAAWPYGVSMQSLGAGSGWSLNGGFGTVITSSISSGYTVQEFYKSAGGTSTVQSWERTYNAFDGGGGWTGWRERQLTTVLTAASFTQLTAAGSYPNGRSKIYYTSANSASWDFNGMNGEVETHWDSTNSFARQTFTQKATGGTNYPEMWIRTSDNSVGWSAWKKLIHGVGAWNTYTPIWTASTTNPAIGNGTLIGRYCKVDRLVTGHINLIAGSGTTFGAGGQTFTLPPFAVANNGASYIGHAQLLDSSRWTGQVVMSAGATTLSPFFPNSSTNNTTNFLDQAVPRPATLTTAAQLRMTFAYESAT